MGEVTIQRRHLVLRDDILEFAKGSLARGWGGGCIGQGEDILRKREVWIFGILGVGAHDRGDGRSCPVTRFGHTGELVSWLLER